MPLLKRVRKILLYLVGLFLLAWLIWAQFSGKFRISDADAANEFATEAVAFKPVYFTLNGRTMHYVVAGNDDTTKSTIVFIHGSPGSWDAFKRYLLDKDLLQHYRLISIDRPGFGYSDFGSALNFKEQGVLLSETLQRMQNGKPMVLVGHSLGGPMVIKLAAENSNLPIRDIVVLAGSVDPAEEEPEKWRPVLDYSPLRYFIPGAMRPSNAELWMFKKDVYDLAADWFNVHCNVVLMHGDSDQLVPPPNALYSKAHLTNAKNVKLVWFKGEDHFIPWTKFEEIKDELLKLDTK